jgi:hypothetical protein
MGARYQGMGGAGVATVNDAHAAYWNPGALGFGQGWSIMAPFSVQASSENNPLGTLDEMIEVGKEADAGIRDVRKGGALKKSEVRDLLDLIERIADIDPDGEGFTVESELGLRGNAKQVGLEAVANTSAGIQLFKDDLNLQLSIDTLGPLEQVLNVVGSGADHSAGSQKPFRESRSQTVADRIANKNAAWSQDQAEEFVFQAEKAGYDMDDSDHREVLQRSARQTGSNGDHGIDLNSTGAFVRGIIATEIGLGYGRAFEIPYIPGKVSFGAVPKIVVGTTFFDFIPWDEVDSVSDAIDRLLNGTSVRTSTRFGLDLGMMAKPLDRLTLGLTARNVNKPSFSFAGSGDYELDPQVRTGIAYGLTENWLIAFDADLTENDHSAVQGFHSRQLSGGTEYWLPLKSVRVALRMGAWTNVASGSNDAVALSGGLSVGKGGFLFDFAVGSSASTVEIEDVTLPERMNFAVNFRYEKRF